MGPVGDFLDICLYFWLVPYPDGPIRTVRTTAHSRFGWDPGIWIHFPLLPHGAVVTECTKSTGRERFVWFVWFVWFVGLLVLI